MLTDHAADLLLAPTEVAARAMGASMKMGLRPDAAQDSHVAQPFPGPVAADEAEAEVTTAR